VNATSPRTTQWPQLAAQIAAATIDVDGDQRTCKTYKQIGASHGVETCGRIFARQILSR